MSAANAMRIRTLLLLIACTGAAHAQSSAEVNAGIQFNFASPGARSLGRGGAFIADASDATASYANPAGLVNMHFREISAEFRASRFTNEYSDRGHAFGPPSEIGDDTVAGIEVGRSTSRVDNVSFASVVFPARRWTLAAYRHELANISASARTQGVFFDTLIPETGKTSLGRHFPALSTMRLNIVGTGVSAAVRGPRGVKWLERMAFGIGVRRFDSRIESVTERYDSTELYGPPDYESLNNVQTQEGSGHSIGVNAGYLFDITRHVSIGATYRQGFSFPVTAGYRDARGDRPPQRTRFHVPSFYGVGLFLRPQKQWSIALDVNHIPYSDMTRDFVLFFIDEPRYFVRDATEVRLGTEYIVTRDQVRWLPAPIALSAGAWHDPDHSVQVADPRDSQAALFLPTRADTHISAGVGVLARSKAQFHVAVDHSRRQTVVSISTMVRF